MWITESMLEALAAHARNLSEEPGECRKGELEGGECRRAKTGCGFAGQRVSLFSTESIHKKALSTIKKGVCQLLTASKRRCFESALHLFLWCSGGSDPRSVRAGAAKTQFCIFGVASGDVHCSYNVGGLFGTFRVKNR